MSIHASLSPQQEAEAAESRWCSVAADSLGEGGSVQVLRLQCGPEDLDL